MTAVSLCSCQSPLQVIVLAWLHRLRPLLQDIECLDPKGLLLPNNDLHAVCRRPVVFATDAGNVDDDVTEADYPPADSNSTPKASSSSDTGSGSTGGSGSGQEEESPAQLGGSNTGSGSNEEVEDDKEEESPADVLGNEASSEGDEHAEVQSSYCISHIAGFQVMLALAGFTATCAVMLEHAKHACSAWKSYASMQCVDLRSAQRCW